jgi:hypothetical protein
MRSTRDLNGVPFAEIELLRIDTLFLSIGEDPMTGLGLFILLALPRRTPSIVPSFSLFPFVLHFIRFDEGNGGIESDDFIRFRVG